METEATGYERTDYREKNLLMYLETCCVDHDGLMDGRKVNAAEMEWMKEWAEIGLITIKRLPASIVCSEKNRTRQYQVSHLVSLSEEAWDVAHKERRARAIRGAARRDEDGVYVPARKEGAHDGQH